MPEVWPFQPETLRARVSWLTSVLSSFSTEQRAALRLQHPRIRLRLTSLLTKDRTFYARRIAERANGDFWIPDWRYAYEAPGPFSSGTLTISDVPDYFYPAIGDSAIAWKSEREYHLFTISNKSGGVVTADSGPATEMRGFLLLPALSGYHGGSIQFRHGPNNVNEVHAELESFDYADLSSHAKSFPSYQGFEVYTDRDLLFGNYESFVHKVVNYVDGQTGTVDLQQVFDHTDFGATVSYRDQGPSELIKREGWFHVRKGKAVPFWKPSWETDILLQSGASSGSTTLLAEPNAPDSDYVGRRICIAQGANLQFNEIVSATEAGGTLTIGLLNTLSADVNLAALTGVSEMSLYRLDADEIDFDYEQGLYGKFSVPVVSLDNDL